MKIALQRAVIMELGRTLDELYLLHIDHAFEHNLSKEECLEKRRRCISRLQMLERYKSVLNPQT